MALNPKGFWRVLVVLYALFAVTTVVVTGIAVRNALECPNQHAKSLAEHRHWQQLPHCQHPLFSDPELFRCAGQPDQSIERALVKARAAGAADDVAILEAALAKSIDPQIKPQIYSCDSPLSVIGIGLLVLAVGFGVMFGGGLVVRWVVRGFMPRPKKVEP